MINFLRRIFIKDYQNVNDSKVREAHGKLASFVGVFSNLFLFIIKMIAGIISGSIAIIADSINNLSDMGSSVITLVGFKLANAPADEEHPYGHQRIEYISGLIVAIIILYVGGSLLVTSVEKIFNYEVSTVDNNILFITIGILSISILIKLWQSLFNHKVGKIINSLALEATSADSRNDCISTAVILLGTIVMLFIKDLPFSLDGVMGILVSLFILYSGINLIKETMDPLIGVTTENEFVKNIIEFIKKQELVLGIHDPVCHMYGPTKCFMTIHVEVDSKQDLLEIHDVIDNIEKAVMTEFGVALTIHMDPIQTDNEEINLLREKVKTAIKTVSPCLSIHDFRVVIGPTHTNILFDMVVPFKFHLTSDEILKQVGEMIKEEGKTYYFVVEVDRQFVKDDCLNEEY
jgi:cation diffusion facilitator family transporter